MFLKGLSKAVIIALVFLSCWWLGTPAVDLVPAMIGSSFFVRPDPDGEKSLSFLLSFPDLVDDVSSLFRQLHPALIVHESHDRDH